MSAPLASLQRLADADQPAAPVARWRGLAFHLDELNFAVADDGATAAPAPTPTPLPLTHDWVRGVAAVDGVVYIVIDFAAFIGRRAVGDSASGNGAGGGRASLLLLRGEGFNSALLVDSRVRVRDFSQALPDGADGGADGVNGDGAAADGVGHDANGDGNDGDRAGDDGDGVTADGDGVADGAAGDGVGGDGVGDDDGVDPTLAPFIHTTLTEAGNRWHILDTAALHADPRYRNIGIAS